MAVVMLNNQDDVEYQRQQNDLKSVATFLQGMKQKQQQNQAARIAAEQGMTPEFSISPTGMTTTYKRPNVKEMYETKKMEAEAAKIEAEGRLLQYKLERAMAQQQGNTLGDNSDMYPKTYKPDKDTGVPSPATFGSRNADERKMRNAVIQKSLGDSEGKAELFKTAQDMIGQMEGNFNASKTSPVEQFTGGAPGPIDDIAINAVKKIGKGLYRKAASASGYDQNLGQYGAQKKGFIGNLARSVGAEKGVLTDPDIQRIASLLPSEFSNETESRKKFNEINKTIKASLRKAEIKKRHYMTGSQEDPEMPELQYDPQNDAYALVYSDGRYEEI